MSLRLFSAVLYSKIGHVDFYSIKEGIGKPIMDDYVYYSLCQDVLINKFMLRYFNSVKQNLRL